MGYRLGIMARTADWFVRDPVSALSYHRIKLLNNNHSIKTMLSFASNIKNFAYLSNNLFPY